MSIKVMTEVWEHSAQKGARLLLLLAIADHADDDGFAWPGLDRLAAKTRMSRRQTITNLQALIADGELQLIDRGGAGARDTNRYRVIVKGANIAPSKGAEIAPSPETKGAVSANKGAVSANKGAVATAPEPSVEPSLKPSDGSATEKQPPQTPKAMHALDPVADRDLILRGTIRPFPPSGASQLDYIAWEDLRAEYDRRRPARRS